LYLLVLVCTSTIARLGPDHDRTGRGVTRRPTPLSSVAMLRPLSVAVRVCHGARTASRHQEVRLSSFADSVPCVGPCHWRRSEARTVSVKRRSPVRDGQEARRPPARSPNGVTAALKKSTKHQIDADCYTASLGVSPFSTIVMATYCRWR